MICKIAIDIAAAATIECDDGEPPITRDGPPGCDIGGDAPARPEPHVDAGGFPLHGVDAAADVVEAIAVGVGFVG